MGEVKYLPLIFNSNPKEMSLLTLLSALVVVGVFGILGFLAHTNQLSKIFKKNIRLSKLIQFVESTEDVGISTSGLVKFLNTINVDPTGYQYTRQNGVFLAGKFLESLQSSNVKFDIVYNFKHGYERETLHRVVVALTWGTTVYVYFEYSSADDHIRKLVWAHEKDKGGDKLALLNDALQVAKVDMTKQEKKLLVNMLTLRDGQMELNPAPFSFDFPIPASFYKAAMRLVTLSDTLSTPIQGADLGKLLSNLPDLLSRNNGSIILSGAPRTGKTTFLMMMYHALASAGVACFYIPVLQKDMGKHILDFLAEQVGIGEQRRIVVFIDDLSFNGLSPVELGNLKSLMDGPLSKGTNPVTIVLSTNDRWDEIPSAITAAGRLWMNLNFMTCKSVDLIDAYVAGKFNFPNSKLIGEIPFDIAIGDFAAAIIAADSEVLLEDVFDDDEG